MRISSFPTYAARTVVPAVAAVLVVTALAGCGKDGSEDAPTTAPTVTASAAPTPDPTPSASPTPVATRSAEPTPAPSESSGGNGDGEDDDEPATAGGGICADLDAADVGGVLGVTVTGSALPGGGCLFQPRDPQAPAVSVVDTPYRPKSGMAGAKTDATSSVEGEPEDLPSIGDAAFVVTGTAFGGEDVQGAGAVRLGDRLVSFTLAQSEGLPRTRVRALVVGMLRLAVSKAG